MEEIAEDPSEDYPPPRKIRNCEHVVQVTVVKFKDLKRISLSDPLRAYPHMSAQGNRYIIVMEDSNAGPILATAIKSRKKDHVLGDSLKCMIHSRRRASIQYYIASTTNF